MAENGSARRFPCIVVLQWDTDHMLSGQWVISLTRSELCTPAWKIWRLSASYDTPKANLSLELVPPINLMSPPITRFVAAHQRMICNTEVGYDRNWDGPKKSPIATKLVSRPCLSFNLDQGGHPLVGAGLDSALTLVETRRKCMGRARQAEARLRRLISKYWTPPTSARNLHSGCSALR